MWEVESSACETILQGEYSPIQRESTGLVISELDGAGQDVARDR